MFSFLQTEFVFSIFYSPWKWIINWNSTKSVEDWKLFFKTKCLCGILFHSITKQTSLVLNLNTRTVGTCYCSKWNELNECAYLLIRMSVFCWLSNSHLMTSFIIYLHTFVCLYRLSTVHMWFHLFTLNSTFRAPFGHQL